MPEQFGSKRNNIGYLSFKKHKNFKNPNSLYIKKKNGKYWISFCYGEATQNNHAFNKENLAYLNQCDQTWLEAYTVGIDRGVARPVQANDDIYDFTANQKRNKEKQAKYLKRLQHKLARGQKGSARYKRTKQRIARKHENIANIRKDFCHKTSHQIVTDKQNKIIVLEDLNTKGMTKRPKAKPNNRGGWEKNNSRAKAGLNKAILDKGWHQLEIFIAYKAQRAGKAFFKVSAKCTSQECADCGYTHPDNRQKQTDFVCGSCGHTDNADRNAALVIKKRAIKLILHSGTELSKRGVLHLDTGRGAKGKSSNANALDAVGSESSKKKRTVATKVAA